MNPQQLPVEVEQAIQGNEAGCKCNRNSCPGIIAQHETHETCSCHNNPPCSYCTTPREYCPECDWDAQDEQRAKQKEADERNQRYYKEERDKWDAAEKLFKLMFDGQMPAEKLVMRTYPHTHFSQYVRDVFPKGSETYDSIRPQVIGTFGGRFTWFNDHSFEYIAYTD